MHRVHIPNMFFIQGAAHQGKSTLTRHFRQSLNTEVVQTDQLFWRWCDKYHPKETRNVRVSLGRYFPHLPADLRREWFEYMTNYVLSVTRYARPDMVIEGWLLTLLPKDLKEVLHRRCSILTVTMREYAAHTSGKTFKPTGTDYLPVVDALKKRLTVDKERDYMPRVTYQKFEDCKHCAGRSDSLGRFQALELPEDMSGTIVLDMSCDTGYNAIRCAQRGATVYAVDTDENQVRLASRIANSIYRLPKIRFYYGDILVEEFKTPVLFDYIICQKLFNKYREQKPLFDRASEMLKPDGLLLAETLIPKFDVGNPLRTQFPYVKEVKYRNEDIFCPNDKTVMAYSGNMTLSKRTKSIQPGNSLLGRIVYSFTKRDANGLDVDRFNLRDDVDLITGNRSMPARKKEESRMVTSDVSPMPVILPNRNETDRGGAVTSDRYISQFEELSLLESTK
jgi:2-polyprenyl-3-methyl-5-hydroxy-6-metoxy-1,4-benzoquinol methylase